MSFKLLTVEEAFASDAGVHLRPGVLLAWWSAQPELKELMQGAALEPRRPNGSALRTTLLQCGAGVTQGEGGGFSVPSDENGPIWTIVFTLPLEVRVEDVPPGTEIWFAPPGEKHDSPN